MQLDCYAATRHHCTCLLYFLTGIRFSPLPQRAFFCPFLTASTCARLLVIIAIVLLLCMLNWAFSRSRLSDASIISPHAGVHAHPRPVSRHRRRLCAGAYQRVRFFAGRGRRAVRGAGAGRIRSRLRAAADGRLHRLAVVSVWHRRAVWRAVFRRFARRGPETQSDRVCRRHGRPGRVRLGRAVDRYLAAHGQRRVCRRHDQHGGPAGGTGSVARQWRRGRRLCRRVSVSASSAPCWACTWPGAS